VGPTPLDPPWEESGALDGEPEETAELPWTPLEDAPGDEGHAPEAEDDGVACEDGPSEEPCALDDAPEAVGTEVPDAPGDEPPREELPHGCDETPGEGEPDGGAEGEGVANPLLPAWEEPWDAPDD